MVTPQNGYLDGSGSSPFGAHADHEHDYEPKNSALLKAVKMTIAVDDWDEGAATVSKPEGITAYIDYVVDYASASAASTSGLALSEVGSDTITFTSTTTPESPIDVWVLFL